MFSIHIKIIWFNYTKKQNSAPSLTKSAFRPSLKLVVHYNKQPMEDKMPYFRKDGSLDITLVGLVYPLLSEIEKLCKTVRFLGYQFQKKNDGGVKVYLPETERGKDGIRNFILSEDILSFDRKPKILIEAAEHDEYENGEKKYSHIFTNPRGYPLISFFVSRTPRKQEGHAFFTIEEGYELIVFLEAGVKKIQIIKLDQTKKSIFHCQLNENVLYQESLEKRIPNEFWCFKTAITAAVEKFDCKGCTHVHFLRK